MGKRGRARRGRYDSRLANAAAWAGIVAVPIAIIGIVLAVVSAGGDDHRSQRLKARVAVLPTDSNAVVPKAVADLPAPPSYREALGVDRCHSLWLAWLPSQRAAPVGQPPAVQLSAPRNANVAVTAARARVFRSYAPRHVTEIRCTLGAGPVPGTRIDLNLDRPGEPPTIVSESGRDVPLSLQRAVIDIPRGQTQPVAVYSHGRKRFYEWSVELELVVDQRPQRVVLGSPGAPLRSWLGALPSPVYDFDARTHQWRSH
jgi:hypothetical protein